MPNLAGLLDEIFTPETADDTNDPNQLGRTMIFGYDLTPDEIDQLIGKLGDHATTARKAAGITPRRRQLPPRAQPRQFN